MTALLPLLFLRHVCDCAITLHHTVNGYHPLLQRAMDLMLRLHKLLDKGTVPIGHEGPEDTAPNGGLPPVPTPRNDHRDVLFHGAGEIMGGLAQALSDPFHSSEGLSQFSSDEDGTVPFLDSDPFVGLSVLQMKRALRGAAFARGALFNLRAAGSLDPSAFDELHDTIEGLETDMYAELTRLRQRHAGEP